MMTKTPMPQAAPAIESPCIQICVIDAGSGLCTGCGRTRHEIAIWSSITSAERGRIMSELAARKNAATQKR
jgi:uncharacterized protein